MIHVRQPYGWFGTPLSWSVELDDCDNKTQISDARSQLEDSFPHHTFYQATPHCQIADRGNEAAAVDLGVFQATQLRHARPARS